MPSRGLEERGNGLTEIEKAGNLAVNGASTHLRLCAFNLTLSVSFEREIQPLHTDCKPKLCSFRLLNLDSHWFTYFNCGGGWATSVHLVANDFRRIKRVYYIINGPPSWAASWCTVYLQNSSSLGFRTEGYVFMSQYLGFCKPAQKPTYPVGLFSHSNKVLGFLANAPVFLTLSLGDSRSGHK